VKQTPREVSTSAKGAMHSRPDESQCRESLVMGGDASAADGPAYRPRLGTQIRVCRIVKVTAMPADRPAEGRKLPSRVQKSHGAQCYAQLGSRFTD
jgi:hypothetical protein